MEVCGMERTSAVAGVGGGARRREEDISDDYGSKYGSIMSWGLSLAGFPPLSPILIMIADEVRTMRA
jgi:hypothetical protein